MERRQLEYFLAIDETGSFTGAARQCFVAQPSLSQQIQKLEEEIGSPLFHRLGRSITLTEAGKALLPKARHILMEMDNALAAAREHNPEAVLELSLGAIPTIAPYLIPRVVQHLREQSIYINITIREKFTAQLVDEIIRGKIEIALTSTPINHEQIDIQVLFQEPFAVALPAEHPLAAKRTLNLKDLIKEPFILLQNVHCAGQQVEDFCLNHRFSPNVICESAQIATVQEMVALGLGISLLPQMAVHAHSNPRIQIRPFARNQPTREIALIRHKNRYRSRAARAFIEAIQNQS